MLFLKNSMESKAFQLLEMTDMEKQVSLEEVQLGTEHFYKISNVDGMRPFFMTIVSDSNHWLFLSSNGGISAGRKNAEFALFPYYTDDKITESAEHTGCKTIFIVEKEGEKYLWEPFSIRNESRGNFQRNLYKNRLGNKVIFEEINLDLNLAFRYEWNTSRQFGFVRKCTLENNSLGDVQVHMLDGLLNLVPYGVGADLQNSVSNLADAYKRSELLSESGLGIFALSAIIVDKAEPSEALKATTAWASGLDQPTFLLSSLQLDRFRKGQALTQEEDIKGEKGAYLVSTKLSLPSKAGKNWAIVANVNQNQAAVAKLSQQIASNFQLFNRVLADVETGTKNLLTLNASADGLQYTADDKGSTRHFSNVLFNIMRGGIFDHNYQIEKTDFLRYLQQANRQVFSQHESDLKALPEQFSVFELKKFLENDSRQSREHTSNLSNNALQRLAREYLPLRFSRRHGDPSRPWNKFTINTESELDGSKILDYEGNWRDIFQNWEALAHAYPEFIEGMIFKFLNASTFDGYNPYRVTKGGFDWETIEPDNPWSYIGYWGDHQIIYLLKLLEFAHEHNPKQFQQWFSTSRFVYANVPYKIKPYAEIVSNPKDTIEFDHQADKAIHERMNKIGADGALLCDRQEQILEVSFGEKILATVLAKLSNLVPEGGIWMNTQRPEWNDANNALVGNGLSMVTVCYLRRFLTFFIPLLQKEGQGELTVSNELVQFFNLIKGSLEKNLNLLSSPFTNEARKHLTDALGKAAGEYRTKIYQHGFEGAKSRLSYQDLGECFAIANRFLDHTIAANKRSDFLYHTYNLIAFEGGGVTVSHLSEMLEGQVAVLSSGYLSAAESLQLLDSLRQSSLYREDQNSYILYPNKELPRFLEKNRLPVANAQTSKLLSQLLEKGNKAIVEQDVLGHVRFNGNFRNSNELKAGLEKLDPEWQHLVKEETNKILALYEEVFQHKAFTGRSGTFFGYEGLGSIYWHMVSKLLLAVQETCLKAIEQNESEELVKRLLQHYYQIQDGIGVHKTPTVYGAFPTDPYSHTPLGKGAQQPGMTGQVKEDILSRIGELGIRIDGGKLRFNPVLLKRSQFLDESQTIEYVDVQGHFQSLNLEKGSLFFTYCQVPIVYVLSQQEGISIEKDDGWEHAHNQHSLSAEDSASIFERRGEIRLIRVQFQASKFRI